MITVGILGASGYSGNELVSTLAKHKGVELLFIASKSNKGKKVCDIYQDSKLHLKYSDPSIVEINRADAVFLALPKEESLHIAPKITSVVIDLSPAHRFDPEYVYGLPEANSGKIRETNHIANPGCYATACILGILPLSGDIFSSVAFDCKSGYSGGGRTKKYDYSENVVPYSPVGHYQEPEIAKFLSKTYSFAPHVVNSFRGLIATIHVFGIADHSSLLEKYKKFYSGKPFVKLSEEPPSFNTVKKTPNCVIGGFSYAKDRAVFISAIDNLLKGASSGAVQNMNIRFGFNEGEGLI